MSKPELVSTDAPASVCCHVSPCLQYPARGAGARAAWGDARGEAAGGGCDYVIVRVVLLRGTLIIPLMQTQTRIQRNTYTQHTHARARARTHTHTHTHIRTHAHTHTHTELSLTQASLNSPPDDIAAMASFYPSPKHQRSWYEWDVLVSLFRHCLSVCARWRMRTRVSGLPQSCSLTLSINQSINQSEASYV